jgi:hypothetical protein
MKLLGIPTGFFNTATTNITKNRNKISIMVAKSLKGEVGMYQLKHVRQLTMLKINAINVPWPQTFTEPT